MSFIYLYLGVCFMGTWKSMDLLVHGVYRCLKVLGYEYLEEFSMCVYTR